MTPSNHTSFTLASNFSHRTLGYALLLSLSINVLSMGLFLIRDKTHRETLVPPTIHKTFWVEDSRVDPVYLEQMAVFLLQLVLNTTPATSEGNLLTFLNYTGPESYGELAKSLRAQAATLKAGGVSTAFYPRAVTVAPDAPNTIAVAGLLSTFAADKKLPDRPVTYLLRFRYSGGRLYLSSLNEMANNKPDAVDIVEAAAEADRPNAVSAAPDAEPRPVR